MIITVEVPDPIATERRFETNKIYHLDEILEQVRLYQVDENELSSSQKQKIKFLSTQPDSHFVNL